MLFSEVIGHSRIKEILANVIRKDRVGHAYIFEGTDGVGRLSLAKAFATRLVCERPEGDDACGICKSCSQVQSDNHPDIVVVTNQLYDKSKKTTDVLVDTIRGMKQEVYVKPYSAERKIYIIPKADTMNLYAQNSLLKVLEEPPDYCTIILLAENSNSFLPTILSRTTILKLFPLTVTEVTEYLAKNSAEVDPTRIDVVARMCSGCIGKAKLLLENDEVFELRAELLDRVFALGESRRRAIYDLVLFMKQNKDESDFLTEILQDLFRDLIYIKSLGENAEITNSDKSVKLSRFAMQISEKTPVLLLDILLKYKDYFSKNISYGLGVQCLSLELWEAINDRGYRSKI